MKRGSDAALRSSFLTMLIMEPMNVMHSGAPAPVEPSRTRAPGLRLFVGFLFLYMAVSPGTVSGIDTNVRWLTARALWSKRTLSLGDPSDERALVKQFGYLVHPGVGGSYMHFGVGQSVAMIPFDLVGSAISGLAYPADRSYAEKFFLSMTFFPCVSALLCLLLYRLVLACGLNPRAALGTTLLSGVCTALLPYSQIHQEETLIACVALTSALLVIRAQGRFSWGAALGLAAVAFSGVTVRLTFSVAVACIALLALALARRTGDRGSCWRLVVAFTSVGVVITAWSLSYNALRFGDPFEAGYGHFVARTGDHREPNLLANWLGPLVAPGKSLILFSPPVLLGVWGASRRDCPFALRAIGGLGGAIFLANVILVGSTPWWGGDWCWGSRYQVHAIPLLMAPAAALFRPSVSRRASRVALGIAILGVMVQFAAVVLRLDLEYVDTAPAGNRAWVAGESQLYARAIHVSRWALGRKLIKAPRYAFDDAEVRSLNSTNIFPFRVAAKVGWGRTTLAMLALWACLLGLCVWHAVWLRHELRESANGEPPGNERAVVGNSI